MSLNVTPVQMCLGYSPAAAAAAYTCPTGYRAKIGAASVTNNHTSAIALTVHIVPSGGSASDSNMIIDAQNIAAGGQAVLIELLGHVLHAGDSIQHFAGTANKLTVTVSGTEFLH